MDPVKPFFPDRSGKYADWYARFLSVPDHHLSLEDYVGPFPVGPAGYRQNDVSLLEGNFWRTASKVTGKEATLGFLIPHPERPELDFRGYPSRFTMAALDRETGELVATMIPAGTFRSPGSPHSGVTAEFHRLLSRYGSKSYSVEDFSVAGFMARCAAHHLILNDALRAGLDVPDAARSGYLETDEGLVRVLRPDPEEHNAFWDVRPSPEYLPDDVSPVI